MVATAEAVMLRRPSCVRRQGKGKRGRRGCTGLRMATGGGSGVSLAHRTRLSCGHLLTLMCGPFPPKHIAPSALPHWLGTTSRQARRLRLPVFRTPTETWGWGYASRASWHLDPSQVRSWSRGFYDREREGEGAGQGGKGMRVTRFVALGPISGKVRTFLKALMTGEGQGVGPGRKGPTPASLSYQACPCLTS